MASLNIVPLSWTQAVVQYSSHVLRLLFVVWGVAFFLLRYAKHPSTKTWTHGHLTADLPLISFHTTNKPTRIRRVFSVACLADRSVAFARMPRLLRELFEIMSLPFSRLTSMRAGASPDHSIRFFLFLRLGGKSDALTFVCAYLCIVIFQKDRDCSVNRARAKQTWHNVEKLTEGIARRVCGRVGDVWHLVVLNRFSLRHESDVSLQFLAFLLDSPSYRFYLVRFRAPSLFSFHFF